MREPRRTLLELLVVGAIGAGLGLTANALNPRGLRLMRDYFPRGVDTQPAPPATRPTATQTSTAHVNPPATGPDSAAAQAEALAARLAPMGLHLITFDEAQALFRDPLYAAGVYVFVDARVDEQYQAGHVPGAWQLDHYQLERYIGQVLPVVLAAQKTVVYCAGGECEDSEFTAIELLRQGADPARVFVYVGGLREWQQRGLPVERGPRGSGSVTGGTSHE